MVMSMVTELAALLSLAVGVELADGLASAEVDGNGLGVALVAAGVGVAVEAGALVQPVRASPVSSPPTASPSTRRRVGEPLIHLPLSAVATGVRVEVT